MDISNNIGKLKGVPLYVQIRESIRTRIDSGEFAVGCHLPSEDALAKEFGVSRMTLRRAMEDLVQDGLIVRKHGDGTLVSSTKVQRDYTKLTSFFEDARARGLKPYSCIMIKEIVKADKDIAAKLMINDRDPVFHIIRKRLVEDEKVVAIHELYIPVALCPWIEDANLEQASLYDLYQDHGLAVEWGSQIVEARSATKEQSENLNIEPDSPVLFSERISYTSKNIPVERVVAVSPGDRFSLKLVMRR